MSGEWTDIFEQLGIEWCPDCSEHSEYHEHGGLEAVYLSGSLVGHIFHWKNRRMTRPSIHKALRKIAMMTHHEHDSLPTWRGVYLRNAEILRLAKRAHLRLPRSVFDLDRARLRFLLGEHTQADRRRMTPSEQADFRAAIRWAARS